MPSSSSVSLRAVAATCWSPSSDIPPGKLENRERQRKNNSSTSDAPKVRRGFSLKINYEYSLDLTSQIAAHLTWFLCLVSWPDLTVNRTDGLPWWRWSGTSTAACFSFWGTLAVAGFSLALTAALFRALRIPWYPRLFAAMPAPACHTKLIDSALLNAHAYKARVLLSYHHVHVRQQKSQYTLTCLHVSPTVLQTCHCTAGLSFSFMNGNHGGM